MQFVSIYSQLFTDPYMDTTRLLITDTDAGILLAVSRFHYLTAAQASRLLYPRLSDDNRYMQRRLKRLADAGFVLRLRRLPTPRYGQAPHVFTLARAGRRYLRAQGASSSRPTSGRLRSTRRPGTTRS